MAENTAMDQDTTENVPKPQFDDVPPNQTIYVHNLNERIKKEELRKSLYAMFSQFGTVLDVVALKTFSMRGQAFIVYKDIPSATNALRTMQNFPFYDKPMKIQYAKSKSDIISKLDGSFIPRDKSKKPEKRRAEPATDPSKRPKKEVPGKKTDKKKKEEEGSSHVQPKQQPPNKILFVEHLPEQVSDATLTVLFNPFPGFREVRIVPGKGVAFVEFENESEAGVAMQNLQHFKITPTHLMVISYAKRG